MVIVIKKDIDFAYNTGSLKQSVISFMLHFAASVSVSVSQHSIVFSYIAAALSGNIPAGTKK